MNFENLVKAKSGEKLLAAIATTNDVKMALAEFLQPKCHCRHRSHEGRIHHRAMFQVYYKLAVAAVDHFLREFFQAPAIQEGTLTFHSHPNGGAVHAH